MYPLFSSVLLSRFCFRVLCLFAVQAHNGSALLAQNLIALQGALEVEFNSET